MLKDTETSLIQLSNKSDNFQRCIEFMKEYNLTQLPLGKHIISDDVYVSVEEYDTVESNEKKYESHREYIDLQYVIHGTELIEVSDVTNLRKATVYDKEKDIIFYENTIFENKVERVVLKAGDFVVLYPEDGHKPGIKFDNRQHVKKAVFKIHL